MLNCNFLIHILFALCLVIVPCSTSLAAYPDYDYEYDNAFDEYWDYDSSIFTRPRTFFVKIGESVTLPCKTLDEHLVTERSWSHENVKILPKSQRKNMEIVDFNDLKVNVTSFSEAGIYICEMKYLSSETKLTSYTIVILPSNDGTVSTTESVISESRNENVFTENIITQIMSTTQKLPIEEIENKAEENIFGYSLLTTLSEAVGTNFVTGLSRKRLTIAKSSTSSLRNTFWTMIFALNILIIIT